MAVYDAAARRDVAAYARRYFARTITLLGLVLSAAALLWAGLFAARNLDQLLTDLWRGISLPFWDALWRIVVVGTLAMGTVLGIEGWIDRLRLYRTRKLSNDDAP